MRWLSYWLPIVTLSSKESAAVAMAETADAPEPETTWMPGNWMSPSAAGVVGLALAGPAGGGAG